MISSKSHQKYWGLNDNWAPPKFIGEAHLYLSPHNILSGGVSPQPRPHLVSKPMLYFCFSPALCFFLSLSIYIIHLSLSLSLIVIPLPLYLSLCRSLIIIPLSLSLSSISLYYPSLFIRPPLSLSLFLHYPSPSIIIIYPLSFLVNFSKLLISL